MAVDQRVNETKNRSWARRHPADRRMYVRNGWNLIYDAIRNYLYDSACHCVITMSEITAHFNSPHEFSLSVHLFIHF